MNFDFLVKYRTQPHRQLNEIFITFTRMFVHWKNARKYALARLKEETEIEL